jgi:hypothetical protein
MSCQGYRSHQHRVRTAGTYRIVRVPTARLPERGLRENEATTPPFGGHSTMWRGGAWPTIRAASLYGAEKRFLETAALHGSKPGRGG